MPGRIEYKASVLHDLRKLDKAVAHRILDDLEAALSEDPHQGELLSGQFKGLRKYRIGEYRVIYSIEKDRVLVLRIGHRSTVYR